MQYKSTGPGHVPACAGFFTHQITVGPGRGGKHSPSGHFRWPG